MFDCTDLPRAFQSTLPYAGSDQSGQTLSFPEVIFQSTLPYAGSDPRSPRGCGHAPDFNPRSPMRGATIIGCVYMAVRDISIHAPLCGERRDVWKTDTPRFRFQSTLPYAGSDTFHILRK